MTLPENNLHRLKVDTVYFNRAKRRGQFKEAFRSPYPTKSMTTEDILVWTLMHNLIFYWFEL